MKRLLLIASITLCGVAGAMDPQWILNSGKSVYKPRQFQATLVNMFGLDCYVANGTDMQLDFRLPSDCYFGADKKYLAIRYRLVSKWKRAVCFFSTKKVDYRKAYKDFDVIGNGTWQNLIVDMSTSETKNFAGIITGFRIDISNPTSVGDKLWLSRVGFFDSREAASKFLAGATKEHDDYSRDTDFIEGKFRMLIPGGTVSNGWNNADFVLANKPLPKGEGVLVVARNGEVVPSYVNKGGFAWYIANKPGKYEIVRVEKSKVKPLDDKVAKKLGFVTKNAKPAEYFTRERLRFVADGFGQLSGNFNRKILEDYVECGFDVAEGHAWGSQFMQAADELGIEVWCSNWYGCNDANLGLEYLDHPCYTGNYIIDEPGTDSFAHWGKVCRDYEKKTGKMPYVNLLPMYANAAQLKYGAHAAAIEYYDSDPQLFRKYCEAYCDNIDTFYISTDIYPLNWLRGEKNTYRDYVESINVVASVARERNREFWCWIQAYGWRKSKRDPDVAEFRWQMYTMLSFGCRSLMFYRYMSGDDDLQAMIKRNGERTPIWYAGRKVIREIKAIGDLYCTYRNLGAFTVNCTEKTPYLKMTNEYRKFDTIKRVESKEPLLIGCFQKKSGKGTAFTVVNMTELNDDLEATLKVDLGGKRAMVWQKGKPRLAEPDSKGCITIDLEGGEGVFVTVD